MDTPLLGEELVDRAKRISRGVRQRRSDRYDGMTESGPGPFFALVPGRDAEALEPHYDEMDPLPPALDDDMSSLSLDPADPEVYSWIEKIDRYTDGAILVSGDGTIHDYTVQLDPPTESEEGYEPGWGTKTRTAIDISTTDLGDRPPTEPDYLRAFPESYEGHVDAPVDGEVWVDESGTYGDVVTVTVSAKNGQIDLFDRGHVHPVADPLRASRALPELWDTMRDEIESSRETDRIPAETVGDSYLADGSVGRRTFEDVVENTDIEAFLTAPDGEEPAAEVTVERAAAAED